MSNPEIAAIRAMLEGLPPAGSVEEIRQRYVGIAPMFPAAPDVTTDAVVMADVPCEWASPPGARDDRVVLYLHGGGYVVGSIESHRHLAAEVARAAGARALVVDYRLAPEHPFPAAVDDALGVYRGLLDAGYEASNIAIAGDSAGGGLTVATMLAVKAASLPQPSCAFCVSPWVDLEAQGGSMIAKASVDPMIQKDNLLGFARHYLASASPRQPLAAPIHGDLSGLAPLLIHVGSAEALLDDSVRLAQVAGAADVPVSLEIWPEMIHVWHFFHASLSDARAAISRAGAFIRGHMDGGSRAESGADGDAQ